jgi:hypothetical protein
MEILILTKLKFLNEIIFKYIVMIPKNFWFQMKMMILNGKFQFSFLLNLLE